MLCDDPENCRRAMPEGYSAVAISAEQMDCPLRVCVVVRNDPEPAAGHFVVLRDTMDARVLLGCLLDAGDHVHRWLELWVQDLQGLADTADVCREALSNMVLDERWGRRFASLAKTDGDGLVRTGWEAANPPPTYLDLAAGRPVHPIDTESGLPWALCRDDAALAEKGLSAYSGSLRRYLWIPELGKDSPFVPVTSDTPSNGAGGDLSSVTGGADLVPFNPGGGLMMVRAHGTVRFEAFCDLLGGAKWQGLLHGRSPLELDATTSALGNAEAAPEGTGRLFLGPHGQWGRMVETFHLKLRMLADALAEVRSAIQEQRRPVLNLTADSFHVRLAAPGRGLPFLWTARVVLVDPGDAVELPIEGSDTAYYLRGGAAGMSIYHPASAATVRGRGTVRIRQIMTDAQDRIVLEGTFATQERLEVTANDLVWLRLNLSSMRVDLYAHLVTQEALAAGEWRFRTVSRRLSGEDAAALRQAEGVPIANVLFDVVPLLSSPCDLYSLGVLAVRTLLVDDQTSLPIALDETFSLARQAAAEYDESIPVGKRISNLFDRDNRWIESLGPCRLTHEQISPQDAFDLIPAELWCDTLGLVIALFPGIGPDSHCGDFGDAQSGGLGRAFDRAIDQLDKLLLRTRSLIVVDWRFSRQVHAAIRRHMVGIAGSSDNGGPGDEA